MGIDFVTDDLIKSMTSLLDRIKKLSIVHVSLQKHFDKQSKFKMTTYRAWIGEQNRFTFLRAQTWGSWYKGNEKCNKHKRRIFKIERVCLTCARTY